MRSCLRPKSRPGAQGSGATRCGAMAWLTDDDLRRFGTDGFIVVPGVVPEALLERADAEIDGLIADGPADRRATAGPGSMRGSRPSLGCRGATTCCGGRRHSRSPTSSSRRAASNTPSTTSRWRRPCRRGRTCRVVRTSTGTVRGRCRRRRSRCSPECCSPISAGAQSGQPLGLARLAPRPPAALPRARHDGAPGDQRPQHAAATTGEARRRRSRSPAARGDVVLAHFLLGHNKGGNTAAQNGGRSTTASPCPGTERWEQTFLDAWTEYPAVRRADRADRQPDTADSRACPAGRCAPA